MQTLETAPEKIGAHNLLGRLPSEFSGKLLAGKRTLKLREGETLFERGDAGDGCYWLRRGVLAVCVASHNGEQRILAILGPGAIVGELAMIDGLPRSASVQAVRDCELTFVSRAAFTETLRRHPEFYSDIVTTLAARLRQSDEDMLASSFLTVRARVARALLQFARQLGEDMGSGRIAIRHRITQSDLAAMAGVARESVSRTLRGWHRQKVLEGSTRDGYVVHKTRLEGAAAEGAAKLTKLNSVGQEGAHFRSYTTNWGDSTRLSDRNQLGQLRRGVEPADDRSEADSRLHKRTLS